MTTDPKISERIKDNPPGRRGRRVRNAWRAELSAVLPLGWADTDRESLRMTWPEGT
jgi:hypothetical protein